MEEAQRDAHEELIRAVLDGMRAWRQAHPRASLAAIAQEVAARLARLRAQLVEDTALASPSAAVGAREAGARPRGPTWGPGRIARGQHERPLPIRGNPPVRLRRRYAVCPTGGGGHVPPR
jgi:hypothetical protein